jgi:hypothetical protein
VARRSQVVAVVAPLAAWACALGSLWLVASLAGFSPFEPATWARWDSAHYEDIARHGYTLVRCPTAEQPDAWCGNAGWFPGYPWLVRLLSAPGLSVAGVALAVSWLFAGATLVLLWSTFLGRRSHVALAYAAVAPGVIYDYAVYPLSRLAFFTVAFLWFLQRRRRTLAGAAAFAAGLVYPIGLTLALVAVIWLAVERASRRAFAWTVGGSALAAVAIAFDQRIETGHWDAYFKVQAKYGHGVHEPLGQIWNAVVPLTRGDPFTRANATAWQTVLVCVVLLAVFVWLRRVPRLVALWAAVTWALPLTATHLSVWRSQAALLPLAIAVRGLPKPLALAFTIAAAVVAVPVALLYLHGELV